MSTETLEKVELGRFFTVSARCFAVGHGAPEMFSPAIDAEWHRLMETPEYTEFSSRHGGQAFGHASNCGAGSVTWITTYEEMYGALPEIWFTREDGTLDETGFTHYRETGEVVAEWNCSPAPGDGDAAPTQEKAAAR
ncbi:hypothetical protein [Streptomyces spiramyceticus]|uniref:hypothetical protein n=1 Tax=Streptomyces spiramyceticus TaxID=299717 RepID=UPI00237C134D|nr:hypothetical protein [Streptomyces spiramyceticus]